jgi:hypothetical protein
MKSTNKMRLRERMKSGTIRLYTYHDDIMIDLLNKNGVIYGDRNHIMEEFYLDAYTWMNEQMIKHVPDHSGNFPIWAYVNRPNLRKQSPVRENFTVRITADVPVERVLISNFEMWHCCLNNCHTSSDDRWDNATPEEIRESWSAIFDLHVDYPKNYDWFYTDRFQATVDGIRASEIVDIRRYR